MNYASTFTGIGGFDLGFDRADMECVLQVEQDKHCLELLDNRWPNVKKANDIRKVTGREKEIRSADVICGGFPCQDVSVAGRRAGLAGERSGLWFDFRRIIAKSKPGWVVIENVPGLLSSNGGKDFAVILRGLVECGYGVAWRILDAQYFGLAQRRRRVFIVGSLGSGRAAEVLFERESGNWDSPPRRETRQDVTEVAGTLAANAGGTNRPAGNANELDFCVPVIPPLRAGGGVTSRPSLKKNLTDLDFLVARSLTSRNQRIDFETENFIEADTAPTIDAGYHKKRYNNQAMFSQNGDCYPVVSFMAGQGAKAGSIAASETTSPTLKGVASGLNQTPSVSNRTGVRRLTPTECERLQGFPDGWTEGFTDSVRYRMLGNAVAVPCAEWIAKRIKAQL